MSSELKLRRGNTSATSTFTGALAEVTVDTDKYTVVVHDGTTAGGYPLAKYSDVSTANVGIIGYVNLANINMKNYVDGQITAANAGVTTANLGMKGYVDSLLGGGNSYGNSNVASYLAVTQIAVANIKLEPSGNITFADGTVQTTAGGGGGSNYGNGNVASYLITNGYVNTNSAYSNSNVTAYAVTMGFTNYSNVNTASYLGVTQIAVANIKLEPSGNITFADGTVQTTAGGGGSTANVTLNYSAISDNTANLSTQGNSQLIDSYAISSYRTAKYIIQATATSLVSVEAAEILVTHNDTNVYISQTNTIQSDSNLFVISGNIATNNVNIYVDTLTSDVIIDFVRISLIARSTSVFDLYGDLMQQSGLVDLMVGTGSEDLNTFDFNDDLLLGGGDIDLLSDTGSVDLNS